MNSTTVNRLDDRLAHTVIHASAGSGKTFQLTNRYLSLVHAGAPVSSILATTFTRLAAGEIRNRLLLRVADAVNDDLKRRELSRHLIGTPLTRESSLALLQTLVDNLDRMQVRTLDSFFGSIVQSFSSDLGLPLGSTIVDEARDVSFRAEAIRAMLDASDADSMITLLRSLTQGSSDRSVMRTMNDVITAMYDLYCETADGDNDSAWEALPWLIGLEKDELGTAIERLSGVSLPEGKKQIANAHRKAVDCATAHDWEGFLSGGMAAKIARGEAEFARAPIPQSLLDAYQPLVAHARAHLVNRWKAQTIATRDLLASFHEQYTSIKRHERALTFTDVTRAMRRAETALIMEGDDARPVIEDIGYRIDAQLRHVLLDEFQDTSIAQWQCLKPFIEEVHANIPPDYSLLCVGDVKQSIYGWRDAVPHIFVNFRGLLSHGDPDSASITKEELTASYRSSPIVIDTVNRVFAGLARHPGLQEREAVLNFWDGVFTEHSTAKADLRGYAELHTVSTAPANVDPNVQRLQIAADRVAELHRAAPGMSIGVLMRTNKAVARMLYELGPSKRNISASSAGGGSLTDAPAVNAVLDLFRLADHPGDTVSAFNVAGGPLGRIVGLMSHDDEDQRLRISHQMRTRLLEDGYGRTITDLATQIVSSCDARELRRLLQLAELGSKFDAQRTLRTDDFVHSVERTRVIDEQPTPVRVMTIHQSKGLEFDAVVLPDLESYLTGATQPPVVFDRAGIDGPITRICRYASEHVRSIVPEFESLFEAHKNHTIIESLCLLYVAMTRARQALYMFINPSKDHEKKVPNSPAGVLRCALATDGDKPVAPDTVLCSHGDASWVGGFKGPTSQRPEPVSRAPTFLDSPGNRLRWVDEDDDATQFDISELLAQPDEEGRTRHGAAIHAVLEHVEWLETFEPDRDVLRRSIRRAMPNADDGWIESEIDTALSMLHEEPLKSAMSRASCICDNVSVERELRFARLVDDRVDQGRIDRLVIERNSDGSIAQVTILDFKTDRVKSEEVGLSAELYRQQMIRYRGSVASLLSIPESQIDVRIVFVQSEVIFDLT